MPPGEHKESAMEDPKNVKQRDERSRMPVQSPGSGGAPSDPRRDERTGDKPDKGGRGKESGPRHSGEEEE